MGKIIKRIGAWLASVLAVGILGVIFQTQNVIARLGDLGADVGMGQRLSMTFYDIMHLGSLYTPFIAIALVIAFLAGGLLYRFMKFGRYIIYLIAGAVAILIMLFLMKRAFFGVHIINGAKDALGISLQVLAGAIGGWVFAHLTRNLIKTKASSEKERGIETLKA